VRASAQLGTITWVPSSKILHVLWSPQSGPLCAYWDPTKAWRHARTMLGVEVTSVELREDLPEVVRDDIESDFEGDDDTPQMREPGEALARTKTIEDAAPIVPRTVSVTFSPPRTITPIGKIALAKVPAPPRTTTPPEMPALPRTPTRLVEERAVEVLIEDLDEREDK
jgi:hypothetical protein